MAPFRAQVVILNETGVISVHGIEESFLSGRMFSMHIRLTQANRSSHLA